MTPSELCERAAKLEAEVRADTLGAEDARGAAELVAALSGWNVALLRRAMLGEAGEGNRGVALTLTVYRHLFDADLDDLAPESTRPAALSRRQRYPSSARNAETVTA
jgi:hypothetical protein